MKFLIEFYYRSDLLILYLFYIIFISLIVSYWSKIYSKFSEIEYKSIQKIHKDKKEIPRLGGLCLFIAMCGFLFININFDPLVNAEVFFIFTLLVLCNIPLFLVSLKEDIKFDVKPLHRLIAILVSSFLFIFFQPYSLPSIDIPFLGSFLNLPFISIIFFTIAHSGYCNGMNLIDGSNGLAGMVIFTTLFSISLVSFMLSDIAILYVCLMLFALIVIFLLFNYPWGTIFLGDSGAYLWGSVLAGLTIILYSRNDIPSWGAVVILFYPSIEMIFSVIRKFVQGSNPLYPDPNHMHLKLFFVIEKPIQRARVANCLVMPMISIIWLSPTLLIPWIFNDGLLSLLSIFLLSIIYFGFYWALPNKKYRRK